MAVEISIDASIAEFVRKLSTLPDTVSAQAKEMARALSEGVQNATTKVSGYVHGIGEQFDSLGGVAEKALRKMGAAGGETADLLVDILAPLGEIVGELGAGAVAAGGMTLAVLGVGAAVVGTLESVQAMATAAVEAETALRQAWSQLAPDEQIAKLAQFKAPLIELQAYADGLEQIKQRHQEAALVAGASVTDLSLGWQAFKDSAWDALTNGLSHSALQFTTMVAPWFIQALDDMGASLKTANSNAQDFYLSMLDIQVVANDTALAQITASESLLKPAVKTQAMLEAERIAHQEAAAAVREHTAEQQRLAKETEGATGQFITNQKVLDSVSKAMPVAIGQVKGLTVAYTQMGYAAENSRQSLKDATTEQLHQLRDLTIQIVNNTLDGVQAITDALVASYERRASAGEDLSLREQQSANRIAIAGKAAALSQLSLNAVIYWFELTRDLALIPGNAAGAPFEAAAAVVTGMIAPATQIIGAPIPFPAAGTGGGGGNNYKFDPQQAATTAEEVAQGNTPDNVGAKGGSVSQTQRTSQGGTTQIVLSRQAGQLLRIAPAGKSTRGAR